MVATLTTKDYSEYIHPSSQTTIDLKQSPLVLMAQACNNIGKELGLANVTLPSFNKHYQPSSSSQIPKCDKQKTRLIVPPQQTDKHRTTTTTTIRKSLSPVELTNHNRTKSLKRPLPTKSSNEYESSPQKIRHTTNHSPLSTNVSSCSPSKSKQMSPPFLPPPPPPLDFSPENPFLIPSFNPMHFFDPTLLRHLSKTFYSGDTSSPSIASANSAFTIQRNNPHYYFDQIIRDYSNKHNKNISSGCSSLLSTQQQQQQQFVCNWMESSEGFCGKRFQSQLALLDHLCTHTSGENNHQKTVSSSSCFYPYKPSPTNSPSCSSLPYLSSSALSHALATAPVSSLYPPMPFGLYPPPLGFYPTKL
ncbi:unnamed protein product [Didymodactylos carnosus]|uniref:C2H2-type domain-containing protein n=1 Tax=Didymodactylos carnosus TaxID=1234261 RepID=A0A815F3Q7_9BILA|nr:unnamed protein product [Didymodactylos carnosus]CAF1319912.1 unnamed protein product [Didymodactylos carnosus]CAF3504755.1 unnamed protein product [Didymodactylos carnosus]CAF4164856.1 unnamed protein product [Didymodactylos carnosus]